MTIALAILAYSAVSIPFGVLLGKFIKRGRGL